MKIYIIGSTGFIGKNLVEYYKDHTIYQHRRTVDLIAQLDLFKPDLIINCAAEIYNKDKMWKANVSLVHDALEFIKDFPSTQMIQLGSSSEYGPRARSTNEFDPINPTDMYAGTKGIATILCQTYAKTYNLDVVSVRPYSPFGPGERPHRLFPNLWKAFKLDQPMTLVQGVHDFCYIDDFVEAIDLIINSNRRSPGEIINVSSGVQTTNAEVLEFFRQITGKQGAVTVDDKFVTPPVWQADISHIQSKYGWAPKHTLADGIKKFLERANYE